MKKKRYLFGIIATLLFLTIMTCVFFLSWRISKLSYMYFSVVGSSAQDCAALLSDSIDISKDRFEEIKKMSYLESTKTPEHISMQALINSKDLSIDVKNIYIMSPLEHNEVKYYVPKDKVDFYKVPENTPLDLVYVLDVLPGKYSRKEIIDYKDDMNRYSFQDDGTKDNIVLQKQTYEYSIDEWGTTITGYSPFYATNGEYLGLLGLDLTPDVYIDFNDKAVASIFFVFLFSIGFLLLEMIYLLAVLNRMQSYKVYYDSLTDVYNRRYFNEKLYKVLKRKARKDKFVVFSVLDIDLFKKFNDIYGHKTGDECLIEFAEAIKKSLPPRLSYTIRYGGEEFIACFTADSEQAIQDIFSCIQVNVASISLTETSRPITCSIGCCYCTIDVLENASLETIIKTADKNLYYVKENGRNNYKISIFSFDKKP